MDLNTKYNIPNTKYNHGFTLLLAVLSAAILLTIALGVFNITFKGSLLSGTAEESQFAFYAADAGVECALYWDLVQNAFDPIAPVPTAVSCFGGVPPWPAGGGGYSDTCGGQPCKIYTHSYSTADYCVNLEVVKHNPSATILTEIRARGFSTCDTTNPRRVERALETEY